MSTIDWNALNVGDTLPPLELPPLTRHTLALYCGASSDHNPIHVDIDFAKAAGLPDVIAHGMLSVAWIGRLLTNWVPQTAIRSLDVRFVAPTLVGERITCSGRITEKSNDSVRLELQTANEDGTVKITGAALIANPDAPDLDFTH